MKFKSDIDIDFADRTQILGLLQHTAAGIKNKDNQWEKHNTGIYFTPVPVNPFNGYCSLDYKEAEERGYLKLDFLNVGLYSQVIDEDHLQALINKDPPWDKLYCRSFCEQLIHIGNHYDTLIKMPQAVTSIEQLAMFLAVIRPAKRHLIGRSWLEVRKTIWDRPLDDSYYFKHSHSVAYSHLIVVHMNLLNNSSN
jgi:hypothetical protein